MPTQLLFLQPFPDVVAPSKPGRAVAHWNTSLSNTVVNKLRRGISVDVDAETVRSVLDVRYGLWARIELGVEVPFLYFYKGVLDPFIANTEGALNVERIARKRAPEGQFRYRVSKGGRTFIEGDANAFGLGDVVVKTKGHLVDEGELRPGVSGRVGLKLASGNENQAFGSGVVDWSVGLIAQKTLGHWTLYACGDVTFPGDAFSDADVDLDPFYGVLMAAEFAVSPRFSLLAQLRTDQMALFEYQANDALLGFNWSVGKTAVVQGGFADDIIGSERIAADFTVFLNLTTGF